MQSHMYFDFIQCLCDARKFAKLHQYRAICIRDTTNFNVLFPEAFDKHRYAITLNDAYKSILVCNAKMQELYLPAIGRLCYKKTKQYHCYTNREQLQALSEIISWRNEE